MGQRNHARESCRIFTVLALTAFACASQPARAQEQIPKPDVKPGDNWTYVRTDSVTQQEIGFGRLVVSFSQKGLIHGVLTFGQKEIDADWTDEWNEVSNAEGIVFKSSSGRLQFPLYVGKEYKGSFEYSKPNAGGYRLTHDFVARVVGWEEVTVPAGRFRALRIQLDGSFRRIDQFLYGKATTVYWYAPEVKRWVKYTHQDSSQYGSNLNFRDELVTFQVH